MRKLAAIVLVLSGSTASLSYIFAQTQVPDLHLSFRLAIAVDWQESGYRFAVGASGNDNIFLFTDDLEEVAQLDTGVINPAALEWSSDSRQLAAAIPGAHEGEFIQIWDTDPENTPFILSKSLPSVAVVGILEWSPDGTVLGKRKAGVLASVSGGDVVIWDVDTQTVISVLDTEAVLSDLAWKPDGTQIAAASGLGTLRVWDVVTGTVLLERQDANFYTSVAWEPDGELLAAFDIMHQTFEFWNVSQEQIVFTHPGSGKTVRDEEHLVWGTGGFVTYDRDNRIKIWDIEIGEITHTIQTNGYIEFVEWNPDGDALLYATITEGGLQDAIRVVDDFTPYVTESD